MCKTPLFSKHSSPIDTAHWVHVIEHELGKHRSFESLAWHAERGLTVQPFYRQEDVSSAGHCSLNRGQSWLISDQVHASTAEHLEQATALAADGGADILEVSGCQADSAVRFLARSTEPRIPVMFHGGKEYLHAAVDYLDAINGSKGPFDVFLVNVYAHKFDEKDWQANLDVMAQIVELSIAKGGTLKAGCLDGRPCRNSGAAVSTTVAIILAQLSEWCFALTERAIDLRQALKLCTIIWPVGNSFFMEVAGLRALRLLLPQVIAAYENETPKPSFPHIHATSHVHAFNTRDSYANLICCTTQALSALLGGCESISLAPFDCRVVEADKSPDGRRLARNILLLLRHEAHIGRVADPISGAYYVEKLTDLLAERAWEMFLEIESHGGYWQSVKAGVVESWLAHDEQFTARCKTAKNKMEGIAN